MIQSLKKSLLFIATLCWNLIFVNAQDMIVLKNGDVISAKVREINDLTIIYHKSTNLDGPIYKININNVLSINYENGEKDMFDSHLSSSAYEESPSPNGEIPVPVCNDNSAIIAKYSKLYTPYRMTYKSKSAWNILAQFHPSPNSVLSNEDIEIFFKMPYTCLYEIWIKNKTNKPIYIDLGNTFRVDSDNLYRRYYDQTETISVSSGKTNGGTVNLGPLASSLGIGGVAGTIANGVSVGGGNSYSATTTYSNERIVVVPPLASAPLCSWKAHTSINAWISYGENLGWIDESMPETNKFFIRYGDVNVGECKIFQYEDSPLKKEYSIRYSKDEQFNKYSTIQFGLYIATIIGTELKSQAIDECQKSWQFSKFNILGAYILTK